MLISTYNLDRRVSAHRERELYAWTLLAAVALLLVLAWPFFAGDVYLADALGSFHLPSRAFYAQQIAKGEPFDWMPGLYSGFYLTGQGDAGTYHPLHWLLYRFLPFPAALGWEYLCSYPFMLAGMYLFLRRRLCRRDAAMLGSLIFTFSGFNVLHFVHPNAVAAAAHIPWLLAMIDIILVEAQRWKVSLAQAALSLLTGSQILLGCPQFVWISLLLEAGFTIFLVVSRRYAPRDGCETMPSCRVCIGCWRSSASLVVIGKAIGFLVGWLQLLPMLDSLCAPGQGSEPIAARTAGALSPLNLIQLVAPYLPIDRGFGPDSHEVSLYTGAVPLMLILWVVVRRGELGSLRRLAMATAGLGLAALLMAMVNVAQIVHLGNYLPALDWLESSTRYTVLFQFAVAVLASIGFVLVEREARQQYKLDRHLSAVLKESPAKVLWRQFELLGAVVLVSLAVAVAGLILQSVHRAASVSKVIVGPMLMASAALLVVASAKGVRGALIAMVLFTAADLGYYGLSAVLAEPAAPLHEIVAEAPVPPTTRVTSDLHATASPMADRVFAPTDGSKRVDNSVGNGLLLSGWSRTDGFPEHQPQRQLNYFSLPALRLSGTSWVHRNTATENIAGLIPHDENWLEVPGPLPKARLVTHVISSENPASDIGKIDIDSTALSEFSLALPPGNPGEAVILGSRPGCLNIKTSCATRQMLVVAESYHAGWRCTIDGAAQHVYRINGDFLGCIVEPGTSEVHLEFQPESLRRGFLTSLAGLGLIVCCLASGSSRRKLGFVEKVGIKRKTE
jgi:hypothetical protein